MEAPRGVKRRLAAIFSADVAGYSRLMAEDEVATLQGLTAERELMTDLVRQHHGRVVDSPGPPPSDILRAGHWPDIPRRLAVYHSPRGWGAFGKGVESLAPSR
jgi:hypothetical protein